MRIYFGHSKKLDYENEYYTPILKSEKLKEETLIFPHQNNNNDKFERNFYNTLDLFIAEVSYTATGLGIELGWASDDNIPIYCFYKKGIKPNSSLKCTTSNFIEYNTLEELIYNIEKIVMEFKNR